MSTAGLSHHKDSRMLLLLGGPSTALLLSTFLGSTERNANPNPPSTAPVVLPGNVGRAGEEHCTPQVVGSPNNVPK